MDLLVVFGMALCLAASTLKPLGLILQKYSHVQKERCAGLTARDYYSVGISLFKRPWLISGITVFLCGHAPNIISSGMAPQVMLSCLGTWAIISNAVFARLILRERLKKRQIASMGGMVIGMSPACPAQLSQNTTAVKFVHLLGGLVLWWGSMTPLALSPHVI